MKIKKIRLKNFVSYEDCEINLENVSFCSIVGPNGSGKSTIIEAIIWAAYGSAKIANKDLVRTGETKMAVGLDIELNGKLYSIVRGFNGKAMSLKLEVDGEEVAQGKANQGAEIVKAIGISRELLLQSMAITQGQLSSFVNAYPSERRDLVMEMLDMGKYAKAHQVAKDAHMSMASVIQSHQGTVNSLQERIAKEVDPSIVDMQLKELGESLKEGEKAIAELISRRSTLVAQDTEARSRISELSVRMDELTRDTSKADLDFTKELSRIEATLSNISSETLVLPTLQESLSNAEKMVNEANELMQKRLVQQTNLENYRKLISGQHEKMQFIDQSLNVCPLCGSEVGQQKWDEIVSSMKKDLEDLNGKCQKAVEEMGRIPVVKPVSSYQQEADTLRDRITKATTLSDSKPELLAKLEEVKAKKKELMQTLSDKAAVLNVDLSVAKSKLNAEVGVLTEQIELRQREKNSVTNALVELSSSKQTRATLEQALKDAKDHLEIARTKFPEMDFVVSALAPMGIPLMIVDHYLPVIEQRAGELLSIMSNGELSIRMAVIEAGNKKGIELYVGGDRPVKSLSGGEQTRVSLAIRVALSQILFEMVGNRFDCLLVDEPEYLDDAGIDQFMQSINSLRNSFSQIFVMSHIPKIKGAFPQTISVDKRAGISSATVQ